MKKSKNKKLSDAQKKHLRKQNARRNKKAERETSKLEREIEKIQNKGLQVVNSDSIKELERIRLSQQPKVKHPIEDVKNYRKQRAKASKK
jgi:hypothetical protein